MKTISADRSYVDYTARNFGVRVRRTSCRTIEQNGSEWTEYGDERLLPLTESMLDPMMSEDLGDLTVNLVDCEASENVGVAGVKHELRGVLLGKISMNEALNTSVRDTDPATQ
jgi:hypothetical protein